MVVRKKILLLICGLIILTSYIGCKDNKNDARKDIGIVQLVQHPALDEANKGFIDALKEKGYKDGETISIEQQNASNKLDTAQQIANQFANSNKDLIFAIATPTVQACYNASKDIPIVFTAVTDPIEAGIAKELKSSGCNTTGTSDKVNIDEQLELLKKLIPNAKNIGFIYNTSETNSVNQVNEIKKLAPKYNLKIKEIGVTNVNEINQNLTNSIKSIDALYVPTDNTIASSYDLVGKICTDNNMPIFGAEPAIVEKGGLVSKGLNYYELGKMAGYKAVDILEGKNPSDIEIETMKELEITINEEVAKKLNIEIPEDIRNSSNIIKGGSN